MKDKRLTQMMNDSKMAFDCKRMVYGGFEIFVDA
jgi:uncharacterized protein YbaA (DUF1428 family)